MNKNLDVATYRDGTPIPEVTYKGMAVMELLGGFKTGGC
jgi:hypothetical protein